MDISLLFKFPGILILIGIVLLIIAIIIGIIAYKTPAEDEEEETDEEDEKQERVVFESNSDKKEKETDSKDVESKEKVESDYSKEEPAPISGLTLKQNSKSLNKFDTTNEERKSTFTKVEETKITEKSDKAKESEDEKKKLEINKKIDNEENDEPPVTLPIQEKVADELQIKKENIKEELTDLEDKDIKNIAKNIKAKTKIDEKTLIEPVIAEETETSDKKINFEIESETEDEEADTISIEIPKEPEVIVKKEKSIFDDDDFLQQKEEYLKDFKEHESKPVYGGVKPLDDVKLNFDYGDKPLYKSKLEDTDNVPRIITGEENDDSVELL